jgi:superfamily II DNA or RNA helicase
MLQIAYNNISAYVSGPEGEISELINLLSCSKKGSRFYKDASWGTRRSFLNSRWNSFPTGLLEYACNKLDHVPIHEEYVEGGKTKKKKVGEYKIDYEIIDKRPPSSLFIYQPVKLFDDIMGEEPIELRDYQIEAIRVFLKKERGIVKLPTRSGKTLIAVAIAQTLDLKTLFVVHNKTLLWQSHHVFSNRLRQPIGVIGDGEWQEEDITVGMIQSLRDPRKAKRFLETREFVAIDECHRASDSYQKVSKMMPNARYRLGLSATPMMGDLENKLLTLSITGPIIYEVKMSKLVEEGRIAQPIVHMIDVPVDEQLDFEDYDTQYNKGVVYNDRRNMMIAIIALKQLKRGKRSLILIEKIEHGDQIRAYLQDKAKIDYMHGEHSSELRGEALESLQSGELDILISSRIFNEGIDIPHLESVIVAGGWKAATLLYQRYGRGITKTEEKEETEIFDFIDNCSEILYNHSMERLKLALKEKAFEVKQIKLEDL